MRKTIAAGITAAVLGLGALGIGTATTFATPETVQLERGSTTSEVKPEPTLEPIVIETEEPAPVVAEEPAPAPAPPAIVKCPSGTTAGQVDSAGNESNCQATNNGRQCVEYNDNNQCTAWYKP